MKGVSPISFDFNRMEVSLEKEGRRMTLLRENQTRTCKMIFRKRLQRAFKGKWNQLAHLFSIVAMEEGQGDQMMQGEIGLTVSTPQGSPDEVQHLEIINKLLVEYEDLERGCIRGNGGLG